VKQICYCCGYSYKAHMLWFVVSVISTIQAAC
jgi:hypothetical protein